MTKNNHSFQPTTENQAELRRALGCYGTGVTIISTNTASGPLGMTANSFSSVSLDPPLVLWSPARSSKRHDAFVKAEHFCVHVLGSDQLTLARHFATNGAGFDKFDWSVGPRGAPVLAGCLAEFHCKTHEVHDAGDHSIILGRVFHVSQRTEIRSGLMFDKGRFGHFTPSAE